MVGHQAGAGQSDRKGWRGPTAAMLAGFMEIAVFHPFDTVSKRLMSNQQPVVAQNFSETCARLNSVIFKGAEDTNLLGKIRHLYPGSGYAAGYKVSQRVIKFAGQPVMRDFLFRHNYHERFAAFVGEKKGKMLVEAAAGSFVGVSEVILLPLDRMKVLSQTNRKAVGNRSMLKIAMQEGPAKLYAGALTTAVRNAPGSFLLFGGTVVTKDVIFGLEDYRKATFFQNTVASTVGACTGVFFTAPMDVVKTRIQNKSFNEACSGAEVFLQIIRIEGPTAFFKGITPKIITTAPKLVFSYTMTEFFVQRFASL